MSSTCPECGDEFTPAGHNPTQTYCGQSCANKGKMRGVTGDDHPRWKGGVSKLTTLDRVLQQDGHTCQRCGANIGPSGAEAEVHHIIPRSAGGPDRMENYVAVCKDCHNYLHAEGYKQMPDECPELLERLRDAICNEV